MVTDVCHENDPSCYFSSHQDENASLNEFKGHPYGIVFKLLTKMRFDGKGLGINGKIMNNPIQVDGRPHYDGLGYDKEGDGECSNTTEVREASNEEIHILHKLLVLPKQTSSHGKYIKCEESPRRGEHSKEGINTFPILRLA
jgi:hypothetical protein